MFFEERIHDFLMHFPAYFSYLPTRILNNCILLPIEAESQDTALRIFSTLNDRGKPLSDTDIFKAQFYKYYSDKGQKDEFIHRWKDLESLCEDVFTAISGSPMDELFTRYMYYERAKQNIKQTTTEALRKFYEKDKYAILKRDETFENLEKLASFWKSVITQDDSIFSEKILKRLSVLNNAPNGMWTYLLSVYFMKHSDTEGKLEEDKLFVFLNRMIAFIWAYAVMRPGVNTLRTPAYPAMIDIVNGKDVEFADFKFDTEQVRNMLSNYEFTNQRPITRSMLAWWAYNNPNQQLISNDTILEIEHIFSRQRQINEKTLKDKNNLESLGNKALLEKRINIRASDYRFEDKKKYYLGFTNDKGKVKEETKNIELRSMAKSKNDFTEKDIIERKGTIIEEFILFIKNNSLSLN